MIDKNQILDAMEKKAEEIYENNADYQKNGKRGAFAVHIKSDYALDQWDAAIRYFGTAVQIRGEEAGFTVNRGENFDTVVNGKIAYAKRTLQNSGANFYDVIGTESWWRGALISDDKRCVCGFSAFMGDDDILIAQAGIENYIRMRGHES